MILIFGYRLLPSNSTNDHDDKTPPKKQMLKGLILALLWFALYFGCIFLIELPGELKRTEMRNAIEAEAAEAAQKQQIEEQQKRNERQAQGLPPEREPYQFQNWYGTN